MADGTFNLRDAGIEISRLRNIANTKRPISLQKNLYKINSPYDLTDDIVSQSLNLLQNVTGYDYRNNPVLDVVERLVDSKNSKLVVIGGQRLLVEFGRRAAINLLDSFIPTPDDLIFNNKNIIKTDFKKNDASITDSKKNPSKKTSFGDRFAEKTLGYRDNENYLTSIYAGVSNYKNLYDNVSTSDINYFYSGDITKEKIQQLNQKSIFSTYNVKATTKIDFDTQSLIFKNTYTTGFLNQNIDNNQGLYQYNDFSETYTKSYFKIYPIERDKLTKNYRLETQDIENEQGFGSVSPLFTSTIRQANTSRIGLQKVKNDGGESIRTAATVNAETFRYDSSSYVQEKINTQYGVRRGLVYFTSKLAKENPIIANNEKELYYDNNSFGNDTIYYKGNGECRTFTIYDQYDNYNRVIKFDGNKEKNSVLRDSVLPKIAPMIGDKEDEKYRYFFTMENLAVNVTKNDDCDRGPNGGRWMWFVPYNVKITDNNSINWSELNFLGRPEPVFSYQNTTRGLSLTFSLLIDTVKDIQDVKPTIQNYYNYLYNCGKPEYEYDDGGGNNENKQKKEKDNKKRKEVAEYKKPATYYFKNDFYNVKTQNIDYTSSDTGFELAEEQPNNPGPNESYVYIRPEQFSEDPLSSLTYNNTFLNEFTAATQFIFDNFDKVNKFKININGYASELFTRKNSSLSNQYNSDLGYRRAYGMMQTMIQYMNDNSPLFTIDEPVDVYLNNISLKKTLTYKFNTGKVEFEFVLKSKGSSSASGNSSFKNRNTKNQVNDRRVELSVITGFLEESEDTNTTISKPTNEQSDTINKNDVAPKLGSPCDPSLSLKFQKIKKDNKFPTGFEKLDTYVPSFNSQTPFDFTKRYVFLHQLTRPSKLNNITDINNTVFGRMPVFIIRYGDFIHSKAIAKSINFDISEATWDLNPEGMGAIPLMCTVTMDLALLGGQSLAGPIDKIQTANDSNFIANTTFNTGRYKNNNRFYTARVQEKTQWGKRASGEQKQNTDTTITNSNVNTNAAVDQAVIQTPLDERGTAQPYVSSLKAQFNQLTDIPDTVGPTPADLQKYIDINEEARKAQKQLENEREEARINSTQSSVRINPFIGF